MKLLICEDDISTVDVIQNLLTPNELGISRILRAYNGLAAKDIIEKERPELILCDIGMPICDGVEVLKFIHENKIETEFAFLTCYEDFEYARAAILYGASDYITKPFEFSDLKISLQRMIASAAQKKLRSVGESQARRDSLLSSVLRQLSDGIYGQDPAAADALLQRNGLSHLSREDWQMVVSRADMTDAVRSTWSQELLMYTLGRLHDEALAEYIGSGYTLTQADDRFLRCVCILPRDRCPEGELEGRCGRLLDLCRELMSLDPVILFSEPFPLHKAASVRKALERKLRRMRSDAGNVCRFAEENEEESAEAPVFLDALRIHRLLKKHDIQGFRDYIHGITEQLSLSGSYTHQRMDELRRELIHVFSTCLRDNGISGTALFADPGMSALDTAAVRNTDHMRRFAEALFRTADSQLTALLSSDDIITRAENYIREHFRENINREDVAAIVYITPNYLSKQFRSRKGMNLREFINQIRIEEAKRLLLTTNLSVSEVAGLSGYENISYFSTVFRKHTGMSPVDWRNAEAGGTADEAP